MITTSFGMVLDSNDVADISLCLTLDEIKVKISSNFCGAWDDMITTSNLTEIMLLTQSITTENSDMFFSTKKDLSSYIEERLFGKSDFDQEALDRCIKNLFSVGLAKQISNGFVLEENCDLFNFCNISNLY